MSHNIKPGVATGKEVQEIFNYAKEKGFALPAVNVISSSSINAVLETAAELNSPIYYFKPVRKLVCFLLWFIGEYPKHCKSKLEMGKSCIRFKKPEQIPYALIAELAGKMTVQDWVNIYEKNLKK